MLTSNARGFERVAVVIEMRNWHLRVAGEAKVLRLLAPG
jgi:hypothetical protein